MFNFIVGFVNGQASSDRVVEYTEEHIRAWISPDGVLDPARVRHLPALMMPEMGDSSSPQVARVGHLEDLTLSGGIYRYRFVPSPTVPAIPTNRIAELADELAITGWELNRHHWAVKDVDLYRLLNAAVLSPPTGGQVLRLPTEQPRDPKLVAVMMPFGAAFHHVYSALKAAVNSVGMTCMRADDMWIHPQIMDDILNLLWRARGHHRPIG